MLSYLIIIPLGMAFKIFPSIQAAVAFKTTVGIGLMVGTGIGIILAYIISISRKILVKKAQYIQARNNATISSQRTERAWTMLTLAIAFVLSISCGLGLITSLLLMIGVMAASTMAATITGETGINPMETFGIIILLAIRIIVAISPINAFFIAAVVAVTCGYAGDLLNDYKAGHILGTNPVAQLILHIIGGIIGAIVAAFALFAIIGQFGGVGIDKGLPAGQAFAVTQMVRGIGNPVLFGIVVLIGTVLYLLKVPVMTLGIGVYLPFEISAPMFIGGLIRFVTDRIRPKSTANGNIAASGMLGGEGITGVTIAIIRMIMHS